MAAVTVSSIIGDISQYKTNPARMQRISEEVLRKISDGEIELLDATSPFVFHMENTSVNIAAFMTHAESLIRRQYPRVAQTEEDLYFHMSDKDYAGRFAVPAMAQMTIMFAKDELLNALILDPTTQVAKVTIPRNTVFRVNETPFSLQYPIDIRKLPHGDLQVVYNTTKLSPLQELDTNNIVISEQTYLGVKFVSFTVDVTQFEILSKFNQVTATSGFKTTIPITDQFYYARVWQQQDDKSFKEILTTHSQQIYDPATPTAVLQLLNGKVNVTIPTIYTTTGLIRNGIRIDIYQTKGAVNLNLNNYNFTDFSGLWLAIDSNENDQYVAAMMSIKTMLLYSRSVVSGGRSALSFEALRDRVIRNTVGPLVQPVTPDQLEVDLENSGYSSVKRIDTITERVILAIKPMPTPVDERLITAAASSMATVVLNFDQTTDSKGVIRHDSNSVTLTPDCMYYNDNGVTKLVTNSQYAALMALPNPQLCLAVNDGKYTYTPFYYVLDSSSSKFSVRPYYLDKPEILSKSFVQENVTTGVSVTIADDFSITRIPTGYRLTLKTVSNTAYKDLDDTKTFCQLSFKTAAQSRYAYMLGTQQVRESTDERTYVFDMTTDFYINANDDLHQSSFALNEFGSATYSNLLQAFNVFFVTTDTLPAGAVVTNMDNLVGRFQLPSNPVGISQERLSIRIGHSLTKLWSRGRSINASVPYKKYLVDVPKLYADDVFDVDPLTGAAFTVVADELVYQYLHRKNDPVLDEETGDPVILHQAGSPMTNPDGSPIPEDNYEAQIVRNVDILMIEGVYRFANDSVATEYRKLIDQSLITWITQELETLGKTLVDTTKLYFYPQVTQGDIGIISMDGIESKIPAGQAFKVTLHVTKEVDENIPLRSSLSKSTVKTIDASIRLPTTAVSVVESAMLRKYGSDVIDAKLEGLGGTANFSAITVLDQSNRISIRKDLVVQPDNQLIVKEAVEITYVRHAVKKTVGE